MSRSTDTLTKSTATDYKKMVSNGSIDSMDKSALSSETSYDLYDPKHQMANGGAQSELTPTTPTTTTTGYNDFLNAKYNEYTTQNQMKPPPLSKKNLPDTKVYGLPEYNPAGFELAFRNEGFRDNSTYGGGTRTNSISNYINEESPIIHQTDPDDDNSDYYGNSSTLPMRAKVENLSFLSELKHKLPDYEKLGDNHKHSGHSSFLPTPPTPPYEIRSNNNSFTPTSSRSGYVKQTNSPSPTKNEYQQPEIRRPIGVHKLPPPVISPSPSSDFRRPSSYYTAMKTVRDSKHPAPPPSPPPPAPSVVHRPKAVYEASGDDRPSYSRSKSEALLETNFDEETSPPNPLTSDSRSHSQPLETAM